MYVDEHGDDTSTTTDTDTGTDELTVEVDGETYEVEENEDFDHDGHNDTAVVETADGYIAFADTDHDGSADVAVQFDHDGHVVSGAEYDQSSGEWVEEDVDKLPTPTGDGADDSGHHGTGRDSGQDSGHDSSRDSTDHQSGDTGHTGSHSGSDGISVATPNGEFNAGEAEYDSDGDGKNDTAITTDDQGNTYAFTDTDGDGDADQAVVIEADGDVTVAKNTGGDNWEVVDQGHLNPDGSFDSESGKGGDPTGGSDSVWAEAR